MWDIYVMIPTNKREMHLLGLDDTVNLLYVKPQNHLSDWIPQHLYVTSDEKIKEGDWFIQLGTPFINKATKHTIKILNDGINGKDWRKIIATTDKSLTVQINNPKKVQNRIFKPLPQIPFDFIELYAEKYNSNNQIINLLVEYIYEETDELSYCFVNHPVLDEENRIKIKLIKDTWNKEELDIIVNKALDDALKHGKSIGTYLVAGFSKRYAPLTEESFKNDWIEKNFKFL